MIKYAQKITFILLAFATLLQANPLAGQSGVFNTRFTVFNYDANLKHLFLDVEVKANMPGQEFQIADQNYRFSFERTKINPIVPPIDAPESNPTDRSVYIEQELELSGFVPFDGTNSFFDNHTITGSNDTIVSLNVALAGGDGRPVSDSLWVKVSRLRLEVLDDTDTLCLYWHDASLFPSTVISEKFNGTLYTMSQAQMTNYCVYMPDLQNFLPVELLRFDGFANGCAAELEWETASEEGTEYFVVQKSPDGEHFNDLFRLNTTGGSDSPNSYAFTDTKPLAEGYYRLKSVDFDGSINFSEIIPVILNDDCAFFAGNKPSLTISPNPVLDRQLKFSFFQVSDQPVEAKIFDSMGRTIIQQSLNAFQGWNSSQISLDNLGAGLYFLYINDPSGMRGMEKFIIVHP